MLRVTEDVLEMRHWAESRGASPCRDAATGKLGLAFPGERCEGVAVGWGEFEPTFCSGRCVFVYDDALGATRWFIGDAEEARRFVASARSG